MGSYPPHCPDARSTVRCIATTAPPASSAPPRTTLEPMTQRLHVVPSLALSAALMVAVPSSSATAQSTPLAERIVATDASVYRQLSAVHDGAGNMEFAGLLNRGAVGPHFNFLHRGESPVGSGIGHHFHVTVEEMFVILNGEAQFTINGRTALLQGPVA